MLRKWIHAEFLRPLQRAIGPLHVFEHSVPPSLLAFWNARHGLDLGTAALEASLRDARDAVQTLTQGQPG